MIVYDMSYLLNACQIGQAQKKLKNLRPHGKYLASSSSQKVHLSHTQIWHFFQDTHGDLDLFNLITGNLMQYIIH